MFIVFEGIDNSGKSTLSKKFAEYLNTPDDPKDTWVGDALSFDWTKEPQFTTEEADRLNSPEFKDESKREAFFFADRMKHQSDLEDRNIVCDRYIWTGLAYAKKFSPSSYPLVKHLYTDPSLFIQPDLYIFVDTPLEVCDKRDPSVGFERLKEIRQAYLDTASWVSRPENIIFTSAESGAEESLKILIEKFKSHVAG
jgi:dTMP kinase